MKRRLLTLFSLLLTLLLSVPAMAQDYLAVYLNDGTVDRHMLPLMKSSYASKHDKQGIPHADYVTHVIEMKSGAKYTYAVEEIDSITFAKVDVEVVAQATCDAILEATELLDQCQTPDELEQHIEQFFSIPNVEAVERTSENSFMIKITDGKPVGILFTLDEDNDFEEQAQIIRHITSTVDEQYRNVNSNIRMAIADVQAKERPADIAEYYNILVDGFRFLGYDAELIEMPSIKFFTEDLADYNIVFLKTHGVFNIFGNNLHWHLSGEAVANARDALLLEVIAQMQEQENSDIYDHDEQALIVPSFTINGKHYAFKAFSEHFVENRSANFRREGPKLFFDSACESLKGESNSYQNRLGHSYTADISFANALLDKGMNEFFGYTESSVYSKQTGFSLFYHLLHGQSTEAAYNNLNDFAIEEPTDYKANLMRVVNPTVADYSFISSVFTENSTINSSNTITLNATTTCIDHTELVDFGFIYSTDPLHLSNSAYFKPAETFVHEYSDLGNLHFSLTIPSPIAEFTLYYRAVVNDHAHLNYGEIKTLRIEPTPVSNIYFEYAEQSMYVGDSRELNCIIEPFNATNPVLEWNSSNPSIATVDQNGVVTALAPGECTITASTTDGSGLMASCVITVTERPDAGDYAYVDLGLPSGLMWATCNIGAQNPYDFGDKFAWGETATKQKFTWSTYTWCNGGNTSITKYCAESNFGTVDGLTQLEPEDDAAHIQWGGVWRMPTYDEQVELKDNCYWQWTSGYNGSNVAGFIVYKAKAESDRGKHSYNNPSLSASYSLSDTHIFLPAAGYMANTTMSYEGVLGSYWSSTLRAGNSANANCFNIYSSKAYNEGSQRCAGLSIRPVW